MKVERSHLALQPRVLHPGGEWKPVVNAWVLVLVQSGVGYWLDERSAVELTDGMAILVARQNEGGVRASQLGPMRLQYFHLEPELLPGLITFRERLAIERASANREWSRRIFAADHPLAIKFSGLVAATGLTDFHVRAQLVEIFASAFGPELKGGEDTEDYAVMEAKERLMQVLKETVALDLLDLSFAELAQKINCTPRHLSRVFREVTGMSFREQQAKIRLARASELLANTDSKVVDVALESGYQSLSLFSLMFKRRFGLSPGKWRSKQRGNGKADWTSKRRLAA